MEVLITGASGLVGQALCKKLLLDGHKIRVTTRSAKNYEDKFPYPCRVYEWSPLVEELPLEAVDGVDAIVHLMGEPVAGSRWTEARRKAIYDSRVKSTQKIIETLRKLKNKPKAFVCASAVGIYGDRGDEILTEASSTNSDFLAKVCKDWEAAAQGASDELSIRTVQVRTPVVLARNGGMLAELFPIFRLGLGGQISNGKQWMSWIHLDDLVNIYHAAIINEDLVGPINATSAEPVRNKEFTNAFGEALQRPVLLPVPALALKLAFGDMAKVILASQRVLPEKLMAPNSPFNFSFKFKTVKEALNEIYSESKSDRTFTAEQWIPLAPSEIFNFFSEAENLESITPPWLNFKTLGKSTVEIQESTLIDYKLKIHGVPVKWRTEIKQWNPPFKFIDTQLRGPYKKWHHTHSFIPMSGGTLMVDEVIYKVPVAPLSELVVGHMVSSDVNKIFNFRRQKIKSLFGGPQAKQEN